MPSFHPVYCAYCFVLVSEKVTFMSVSIHFLKWAWVLRTFYNLGLYNIEAEIFGFDYSMCI